MSTAMEGRYYSASLDTVQSPVVLARKRVGPVAQEDLERVCNALKVLAITAPQIVLSDSQWLDSSILAALWQADGAFREFCRNSVRIQLRPGCSDLTSALDDMLRARSRWGMFTDNARASMYESIANSTTEAARKAFHTFAGDDHRRYVMESALAIRTDEGDVPTGFEHAASKAMTLLARDSRTAESGRRVLDALLAGVDGQLSPKVVDVVRREEHVEIGSLRNRSDFYYALRGMITLNWIPADEAAALRVVALDVPFNLNLASKFGDTLIGPAGWMDAANSTGLSDPPHPQDREASAHVEWGSESHEELIDWDELQVDFALLNDLREDSNWRDATQAIARSRNEGADGALSIAIARQWRAAGEFIARKRPEAVISNKGRWSIQAGKVVLIGAGIATGGAIAAPVAALIVPVITGLGIGAGAAGVATGVIPPAIGALLPEVGAWVARRSPIRVKEPPGFLQSRAFKQFQVAIPKVAATKPTPAAGDDWSSG